MIRSYRIRKLLAPAAGFRKAVVMTSIGFFAFFIGISISFRDNLHYALDSISRQADKILRILNDVDTQDKARHILGAVFIIAGAYLVYRGTRSALGHVWRTLGTTNGGSAVDLYRKRLQLAEGPRIVALGGGTGLSTLLRGLKQHTSNITAIVTVTDDGGSSGRLIQDKGIIPPGDIRNCLVALADAEKSMTDLFQHRFTKESGSLSGHSLGNLLIAALVDQSRGDFETAIEVASDVLNIRGRVLPGSTQSVQLRAVMEDGSELFGETTIAESSKHVRRIYLDPETPAAHPEAIAAIAQADLICIGPGSVFTSVIPNLLVPEIAKAIEASPAKKVYICNVMTQKGESDAFSASEHIAAIQASTDRKLFDYVLLNTGVPSPTALERYREANQFMVDPDVDRVRNMGYKVIAGDFMNESDLVRHDPMRVASRLMSIIE